jgi:hypothetical protein
MGVSKKSEHFRRWQHFLRYLVTHNCIIQCECTWGLLMFALDFFLHYLMHVGAVDVCLGFPPPLSNARGGY